MLKNIWISVLCLLFALSLCACNVQEQGDITNEATESEQTSELTVLRVKDEIPKGTKITSSKFEKVIVASSKICVGAISDPDEVIGKYAACDLESGDFFVASYLSDEKPHEEQVKAELENNDFGFSDYGFVVVTDYVTPNTKKDSSACCM